MRIKLKPWNLPLDFLVWSRFQWHSPGFTGSEGGVGVICPIFSLVGAWKFEVQQRFRRIYWVGEVVGAWNGLGSYVQTYEIDGGL